MNDFLEFLYDLFAPIAFFGAIFCGIIGMLMLMTPNGNCAAGIGLLFLATILFYIVDGEDDGDGGGW